MPRRTVVFVFAIASLVAIAFALLRLVYFHPGRFHAVSQVDRWPEAFEPLEVALSTRALLIERSPPVRIAVMIRIQVAADPSGGEAPERSINLTRRRTAGSKTPNEPPSA